MKEIPRREFLRRSAGLLGVGASVSLLPASIRRALAISAAVRTGTVRDVKRVVILMLENRSFDHYFGTLRGVRGFADPYPIPLPTGKAVWFESTGKEEIPPYHLDSSISSALLVPETPHTFSDAQAAWNQGIYGDWPRYKTQYSMGHYRREDIPFQFALAESFTICDAYHCSVTTGTDPNRVVLFSGSNFDPRNRAQGADSTAADAEVNDLRCQVTGTMPTPGYTFQGSPLTWPTLPEVLQDAGVSWRIYQNPNDNFSGLMHGGLAFDAFRRATASSGSPLYENGMTLRTLDDLRADVLSGQLPQVSWILPSSAQSEHPRESTPDAGGFFTSQVLDAITANPAVWSETALLVMFDENDGFFDHIPPPAVPSFTAEGNLAGGSTVPLQGEYFDGAGRGTPLDASELTTTLRPWGMGARVPMYVISPWSRGGWVNSQVFDHTSIGLFLEKVFGVQIASISPWHRAVSGDLTSTFDFTSPNDAALPVLPDLSHYLATNAAQAKLPGPTAPTEAQALFQEPGVRSSRALPYALGATAAIVDGSLSLQFTNTGAQGAVFHVYDRRFPRRLPRRYTVEAGKSLTDTWTPTRRGVYDLEVHAPNGFQRSFSGNAIGWTNDAFRPEILVAFDVASNQLLLQVSNSGSIADAITLTPTHRAYGEDSRAIAVPAGGAVEVAVDLAPSAGWYGFTVSSQAFRRGFAGRLETGLHGISDPAMGFLFENRFHPSIRRWR